MKTENIKPRIIDNILNTLAISILFFISFFGAYEFADKLNEDICHKKELDNLKKEQLKLDIELKKLEIYNKDK
jgi:hypothetical protein